MANGDLDIADELRKKQLAQDLMSRYAPMMQPPGSTPQPAQSQYAPQMMAPPPINVQTPPTDKFEASATALENLPQQPDPRAKDPSGKDLYPRSKLLTALAAPFQFANIMSNPRKGMENLDLLTRKGYGTAEQKYEQQESRAQANFKNQSAALNERLKVFTDDIHAKEGMANMQMAVGKYNQWVRQLPQEDQLLALQIAEAKARAEREQEPAYRPGALPITFKDPNTGKTITREGIIRVPHGRDAMPEYVVPGYKDPIKNEDIISTGKSTVGRGQIEQRVEVKKQIWRDEHDGEEPPPDEVDKMYHDIALEKQQGMEARQKTMQAKTTIGNHINKDYIAPINKSMLGLENALATLQAALGQTEDKQRNAVAAAVAPLEEARNIVGSGRVAVSEYPIISHAPGKPQSAVAWAKNILGLGAPVSDAALNDLIKLVQLHMKSMQGLKDIASEWSYKNLDADTEDAATAAGKSFDAAVKAYQNPKPLTLKEELDKRGLLPKQ